MYTLLLVILSARQVSLAKAKEKPYKLFDQAGLYLYVSPKGAKSWRSRYLKNGKETVMTYGRYPAMSLAEARTAHAASQDKKSSQSVTFFEVFKKWLEIKLPSLSNPKHRISFETSLLEHVIPVVGSTAIDQIKRTDLVEIIQSIANRGTIETAHRVAGRIRMVFDHAVDLGLLEMHPAQNLSRVIGIKVHTESMPSIAPGEAPELFRKIRGYEEPVTRNAMLLLAHTFVRTGEMRKMQWQEILPGENIWLIPGERMKLRLPHVVPLSRQSLAIIEDLRSYSGKSQLVFASTVAKDAPISENTILFALYRLGYRGRMTGHGFRALASTVLNTQGFPADVIERQLAHKETNAIRAAYNRAEYLEQRKAMMQWWSDWIDAQR